MQIRSKLRQTQRGNTIIEFALVSTVLIPLLLGTVNIGMNMSRSVQVTQLSRDAGHMFVRSVDFTSEANQNLLVRIGQGLGITTTGGNGRVTLSRVMRVGENECLAGGRETYECPNYQQSVITQQIIIGDQQKRASNLGDVPPDLFGEKNEIDADDYLTDSRVRANGFDEILELQPGEFGYVSEAYFQSGEFEFPGFFDQSQIYSKTIF
jgi:TadE-like protein